MCNQNSDLRDRSLFSGRGGRAANFEGEGHYFFKSNLERATFFKWVVGNGYEFLSLYISTKRQYKFQKNPFC